MATFHILKGDKRKLQNCIVLIFTNGGNVHIHRLQWLMRGRRNPTVPCSDI